jgi:hypothetical protein
LNEVQHVYGNVHLTQNESFSKYCFPPIITVLYAALWQLNKNKILKKNCISKSIWKDDEQRQWQLKK